ncbi:MAG: hypothetical protein QM658_17780 [Gordonia sp. (in: high G+C Gram-positive bacteria)]
MNTRPTPDPEDRATTTITDAHIDVWMDGFVSGTRSAFVNLGVDADKAIEVADQIASSLTRDPIAVECVRDNITRVLAGEPTGSGTVLINSADWAADQ